MATERTSIYPGQRQGKYGLLNVQSNDDIDALAKAELDAQRVAQEQLKPPVVGVVAHFKGVFEENKRAREESGIEEDMLKSLRQRSDEYDPEALAVIEDQGDPKVFMGITGLKCRAGEGWLADVLSFDTDVPFRVEATPEPELPADVENGIVEQTMMDLAEYLSNGGQPVNTAQITAYASKMREEVWKEVVEEAKERAAKAHRRIVDQMLEGGWKEAFCDFISNLVTFKAGIIKGPILRQRKNLKYTRKGLDVTESPMHSYYAPSPFDIYPSRDAVDCQDGELVERMRFRLRDLQAMRGIPGYRDEAIDAVMVEYGNGGLRSWTAIDQQRSELEKKGSDLMALKNTIEGFECWGSVSGRMLLDEQIDTTPEGEKVDPTKDYEICAIMVGDYLLYVAFNPDPLGNRPYSKTSWEKIPGSFWGRGVPDLMRDLQKICNATIRSLVRNESLASGWQAVYNDISRIPPGEVLGNLFSGKVHVFTNMNPNNSAKPLEFITMDSKAAEFLSVYREFANMADEMTGIPSYAHGNDNLRGAGRTMGGLSMLQDNASRGMKRIVGRIDDDIFQTVLTRHYNWLMLYDDDDTIKGDVRIRARGALAQIIKEQMVLRRMEYLNATNNPVDLEIQGLPNRANIHREVVKALDIPTDSAVRPEQEIQEMEQARQKMAAQAQQPAQAA